MRALPIASTLLVLTAIACSEDDPSPADTASPDSASDAADTSAPDSVDTSEPDSADTSAPDTSDTSEPDTADTADTSEPDTADTSDTSGPDTAGCEYFDNPIILQCGQAFAQYPMWEDFANPAACAPYYTAGDARYDTVTALAQAEGCDATCVYIASQAVDFIRCDGQGRSGFETFRASGEGCLEAVYRTSDGLFSDLCFWATYNCYCTEDPG